jgi:hypothetical protein
LKLQVNARSRSTTTPAGNRNPACTVPKPRRHAPRPAGTPSSRPGEDHAVAARLLCLTLTWMLFWLALLCRRRSTLIAETLTLRHG